MKKKPEFKVVSPCEHAGDN